MSKISSLTPRQQFWVEHLRQCVAPGQTLSAYAAEHGLHVGALYEAKSRLRQRGLWSAPRFVRVQPTRAAEPPPLQTVYRISLPNGVVVESGDVLYRTSVSDGYGRAVNGSSKPG